MAKKGKSPKEKKAKKEKKEPYVPLRGVFGDATDYHEYEMTARDKLIGFVIGFAAAAVVETVFFNNIILLALAGAFCGMKAIPMYQNYRKEKRLKELLIQFKDMLESLVASYSAGRTTVDAFMDAQEDMQNIYGEKADIVKELATISVGMQQNFIIEDLLMDFARRSGLDDVYGFANVFEVCNRQGVNIKEIVADTRNIINDKIEMESEIKTMIAGSKNELNIMMVMPLIVAIASSGLGETAITNNTPLNVVMKVVILGVFFLAYKIGRKITDIAL